MRKNYLDNIRWATILLVLIYHVCYMFNGVGALGGIPDADNIAALDVIEYVVYPWFMVLLFVVAGMSARYSLEKRTGRQFLKERAVKLLIPSTLGLFVIHWVTGYFNIKMGGGLAYIPSALIYPISAVSGIGPLWFIQLLFVFSCLLVLLRKIDKKDKIRTLCKKAGRPIIFLLFVLIFGASHILNMPVLTMYRFGIYFTVFLIGYYVFSHEEIQDKIEEMRLPMLCLALAGAVAYTVYYFGKDYTSSQCLQSVWTNLYLWIVVLALLGCGRKYFNGKNRFTEYMTKASFGIYILHYPVLIVACYWLTYSVDMPAVCKYIIAFAVEVGLTVALYEVIRRVPVVRCLVLGIRKKRDRTKKIG